jgi:hypothetical protein
MIMDLDPLIVQGKSDKIARNSSEEHLRKQIEKGKESEEVEDI